MRNLICFVLLLTLSAGVVSAQQAGESASNIVTIDSKSYYVHPVKSGETVYTIARIYGSTQDILLSENPLATAGIKPGQILKIPISPQEAPQTRAEKRRENKLFDSYTVNIGETAYGITKRFEISVNTLIEDNPGLDPAKLQPGQVLRLRKSAQGQISGQEIKDQWEGYTETINKVSDEFYYRLVEAGETVYSISRDLGVPQNLIKRNNDLEDGLKAGSTIKIPLADMPGYEVKSVQEKDNFKVESDTAGKWKTTVVVANKGGRATYNIAMLLPLNVDGSNNRNYLDFYQGALLALEALKTEGVGAHIDLFNVGRSKEEIEVVMRNRAFEQADIIIGPVYEDNIQPVVMFASERRIPIVSPLATLEQNYGSFVYQMAPSPLSKYDKMKELLSGDNNVVVITSSRDDEEFSKEITKILPVGYRRFAFSKNVEARQIESLLSHDKENIFIVLSDDQYNVDKILAQLSSIQTNRISRSMSISPIRIVGTPKWARFRNIDKDLYFKLRLCYMTSYYAGREYDAVAKFDSRYVKEFDSLPTQYSYRGYDAVKLFTGSMAKDGDLTWRLNSGEIELLEVPYRFRRTTSNGNMENDQWVMVCHNNDYTISVK